MDEVALARARRIISERSNSVLITVDEAGRPLDRIMWTAEVGDDLTVYYATGLKSAKVKRLELDPNVLVLWIGESGYLSLKGVASVTTDPEVLDRIWRDAFAPYFPGGRTDPNYAVIKVKPTEWTCSEGCDAAVALVDIP